MHIQEVARVTGLTAKAIRYYEAQGLVIPERQITNGYRQYNRTHLDHLCFLQHARAVGFTVQEAGHLLSLYRDTRAHNASVRALVAAKLEQLQAKREEIQRLEDTLQELWSCCDGREHHRCKILDRLAASPFTKEAV